jgi:hypothetical protein
MKSFRRRVEIQNFVSAKLKANKKLKLSVLALQRKRFVTFWRYRITLSAVEKSHF